MSERLIGQVDTCQSVIGWLCAEWAGHRTDVGVVLGDCVVAADVEAVVLDVETALSVFVDWAADVGMVAPSALGCSDAAVLAASCAAVVESDFGAEPVSVAEAEPGVALEPHGADWAAPDAWAAPGVAASGKVDKAVQVGWRTSHVLMGNWTLKGQK